MIGQRWLVILAMTCLALLQATGSEGNRVSAQFKGQAAGTVGGILSEVMGTDLAFDHQLISDRQLWLHLHETPREGLLQAVAHAAGGWWWYDQQQRRYYISQSQDLHLNAPLIVRSHPTSLINRHDLEVVIRELMAPWLAQEGSGLASIPWTGQWTATLPAMGHSQLTAILSALEVADHRVPSPPPLHDLPPSAVFSGPRQPFSASEATWADLLLAAADHFAISLALSPDVAAFPDAAPREYGATSLAAFAADLRQRGFSAQWIEGVLCVDLLPITRRRHPIWERRIMVIPIPHLAQRFDGHLVAAAIQRDTADIGWQHGGRACVYIADPARLLISVEESAVNTVLDAIDRLEYPRPVTE